MGKSQIMENFPVTEMEYSQLDEKFGQLCHYAAWQLKKKNTKNNSSEEQEDIVQEIRIAVMTAASYYKRQTYIESNFKSLDRRIGDPVIKAVVSELKTLWKNRTRHGANRQKFGAYQEAILERLVKKIVPKDKRPDKQSPLNIDTKFITYCKQIAWNKQKHMGKRITREKSWRTGLVSLSEFDYLGSV